MVTVAREVLTKQIFWCIKLDQFPFSFHWIEDACRVALGNVAYSKDST